MGIFDGILGAVGSVLGFAGQNEANRTNQQIAQQQMDFQARARETQYQVAVEDMKKAGLNPMLAYQHGGAGNLQGASTRVENAIGAGVNSGLSLMQAKATVDNLREQNKLIQAQTLAQIEEARLKASQTEVNNATVPKLSAETSWTREREGLTRQQIVQNQALVDRYAELNHLTRAQARRELEAGNTERARTWLTSAEAEIKALQVPRAQNEAAMAGTWFGRNVAPLSLDIQRLSNSGLSAMRMFGIGLRPPRR